VGKAKITIDRLVEHKWRMKFDRITIIYPDDGTDAYDLENYYMLRFNPKYNRRLPGCKWIMEHRELAETAVRLSGYNKFPTRKRYFRNKRNVSQSYY